MTYESPGQDIAIVGLDCVFPGAPDAATYWKNIAAGVDAISDVPAARWDPLHYDPTSKAPDRFYQRRGGFVDEHARFDPLEYGVMPVAARGAEPDQLMALDLATRAMRDAGYAVSRADAVGRPIPGERTGVIVGRGNYIGAGMTRLQQHVRTSEQLVALLGSLVPDLAPDRLAAIKVAFQRELGAYGPDTAIGLVPNLTASRIANRLDLHGVAYTLDAACASSLIAVEHAMRELTSGRLDLALAGGVHLSHDPSFWSVFCQLGALSRKGVVRPFDSRADGILIGEGIGFVVLKRTADARRDGDRIYARLRGAGSASDGRVSSLMTPDVGGQRLALSRAWESAVGVSPSEVGLIEAHGTGTPAGDQAELSTIAAFFGREGELGVLGSVKSMIGHTMPAAGMAGLIKAALAVHHGVLPPSLHSSEAHPLLAETRFRVIPTAEPWATQRRVAAVNAFGFGGINAHLILENETGSGAKASSRSRPAGYRYWAAPTADALLAMLLSDAPNGGAGPFKIAVAEPEPERLKRAITAIEKGSARRGRDGLFYNAGAGVLVDGKLAFLFPGIEATFSVPPDVAALEAKVGRTLTLPQSGTDLERQGVGVIEVARLLTGALAALGVSADVMAGHSIGEWAAMIASGSLPGGEVDAFMQTLAPNSLEVPGVGFLAAGTSIDKALSLTEGLDVEVSHDNCPHQIIVCGKDGALEILLARFKAARIFGQILPFRSGFHARVFAPYVGAHQAYLSKLPVRAASLPLYSATTVAPYPSEPDAIVALSVDHLVRPVRFRELTSRLRADGVAAFVQIGQGSLGAFVEDTLRGEPIFVFSAAAKERSALAQLERLVLGLWVEGRDLPIEEALVWLSDESRTTAPLPRGPTPHVPNPKAMLLELGVPLVRLSASLGLGLAPPAATNPAQGARSPAANALAALLGRVASAGQEIVEALGVPGPPRPAPSPEMPPRPEPAIEAPAPPKSLVSRRIFPMSVVTHPYLLGHTMFPQPAGWPVVSDRNPVVPMTMHVRMMMEEATASAAALGLPGHRAVSVLNLRAKTWLSVEPAIRASVTCRVTGPDRVLAMLDGVDEHGERVTSYSEATVVMAPAYPAAPAPSHAPLSSAVPVSDLASALYTDGWMFHGPEYQSVSRLDVMTVPTDVNPGGIDGALTALPAWGALLDGAGQIFGYFIARESVRNRLALPVRIERIDWFGDEPAPEVPVTCTVRIVGRFQAQPVRADLELSVRTPAGARLLCRIIGWEDWRFDTDERIWAVMRSPRREQLSESLGGGLTLVHTRGWGRATWDYVARRYLTEAERQERETLSKARQVTWLLGRVAAKDALRQQLPETHFPVELSVLADAQGRPVASGVARSLQVSIAHKTDGDGAIAIALAGTGPVGVDVERVEARSERVKALAFSDDERQWVRAAVATGQDEDDLGTRVWAAKECAAKAIRTGLGGRPKDFQVKPLAASAADLQPRDGTSREVFEVATPSGEHFRVATFRRGDFIIAYTA